MHRARRGFTMVEVAFVFALIGVLAALGVPSWLRIRANMGLRAASGTVGDVLAVARARAVATGHHHVVYFNTGLNGGDDICGNPLVDVNGNPAPILLLDDGEPGSANQNCCIDAGEPVETKPAVNNVQWGTTVASVRAPGEPAAADAVYATGSSFFDPSGTQTEWVLFRPDGIPVGFADNGGPCNPGRIGTGGGAIYLTNGERDAATVLNSLGTARTHGWEAAGAQWTR